VPDPVFSRNAQLRTQLLETIVAKAELCDTEIPDIRLRIVTAPEAPPDRSLPIDVVISHGEINDQHGTGPLVKRIFRERRGIFSIRFRDDWGIHQFGDWHVKLPLRDRTRAECFGEVLRVLRGRKVRSVTCVPFVAGEILTSIAIKEAFEAKLCLWIMDDQNVAVNAIPDALMRECLEKCSLRLTTHPELRAAYQEKYGLPTYILPAVVPERLVSTNPSEPAYGEKARRGALLGSFWDQSWFNRLCSVLEPCKYSIDWYGQNRSPWMKFPPKDLDRAGIRPFGIVPEDQLAVELRKYPFVIAPVGALDEKERHSAVARLSLPGRILFAAAVANTPVLVVGSDLTCGAHFVKHFGIGVVAPYDAPAVAAAMDYLSAPQVQKEVRRNAAALAPTLSDRGIVGWLAESLERGEPADSRFEDVFSGYNSVRELPFAAMTQTAG
jgi:hypothetical protein